MASKAQAEMDLLISQYMRIVPASSGTEIQIIAAVKCAINDVENTIRWLDIMNSYHELHPKGEHFIEMNNICKEGQFNVLKLLKSKLW